MTNPNGPAPEFSGPSQQGSAEPEPKPKKKHWFARHKVLTVLGAIVLIAVIGTAIGGGGGDDEAEPAADSAADAPGGSEEGAGAEGGDGVAAGIGDAVLSGDLEFTITGVEEGGAELGSEYVSTAAQGEFLLVHVTVTNTGDEAHYFTGGEQTLVDDQGRRHETDGAASLYIPGNETLFANINPGNTVEGVLVFDLPADAVPVEIEVQGGLFDDAVTVSLAAAE